jgi:hypothetical protein
MDDRARRRIPFDPTDLAKLRQLRRPLSRGAPKLESPPAFNTLFPSSSWHLAGPVPLCQGLPNAEPSAALTLWDQRTATPA